MTYWYMSWLTHMWHDKCKFGTIQYMSVTSTMYRIHATTYSYETWLVQSRNTLVLVRDINDIPPSYQYIFICAVTHAYMTFSNVPWITRRCHNPLIYMSYICMKYIPTYIHINVCMLLYKYMSEYTSEYTWHIYTTYIYVRIYFGIYLTTYLWHFNMFSHVPWSTCIFDDPLIHVGT